jgi:hypothetical protein
MPVPKDDLKRDSQPEKPNPYKKDLRKLEEWLKTKQRADALKREQASIARSEALRQAHKKPE